MAEEADIKQDDSTPKIEDQAAANGWEAGYYHFGKLEDDGNDYFNPGIVERQDGLWLIVRRSEPHPQGFEFGQNYIFAFKLDDTGKIPQMGIRLRWPIDDPDQHFEDPRGFFHPRLNQTLIGACSFIWQSGVGWTGSHQALGAFDQDWLCRKMDYPMVGGNPGRMQKIMKREDYEKNWLWFLHEGNLHLLYKAHPWLVVGFGDRWSDRKEYKGTGVVWGYGDIRGGTTPVKVGDYYFTFHHSSLPWKGRYRRYYAGCLAFEAKPPFSPKLITTEPILHGSQNDFWKQRKPLVVFPCGAHFRKGKWLVTYGINDLKSGWIEIPYDSLLQKMHSIDKVDAMIFNEPAIQKGGDAICDAGTAIQSRTPLASTAAPTSDPEVRPRKRHIKRRRNFIAAGAGK